MSKKEIGIIILIGFVIFLITIGIMYMALNNNSKVQNKDSMEKITVGNYTINFGKYKGIEEEYNPGTESMNKKEVFLEISQTMIKNGNSETYEIKNNKLVISSGIEYQVLANNKIELLVGGGIIYEYQG